MPTTEAQKRAMKKWRDKNQDRLKSIRESKKDYFKEYYLAHKDKVNDVRKLSRLAGKSPDELERLKSELAHKQELIDLYQASRAPDSPVTTDEDSD